MALTKADIKPNLSPCLYVKSLYISRAISHFYRTEFDIWACFGPVGNTETARPNLLLAIFEDILFYVFTVKQSFVFLNIVASALKIFIV